jgi:uncharacterized protein YbjT (DUF2867 family)
MNVVVFGASGMVGQGVLRECLQDPAVTRVLSIVRRRTGDTHAKLRELVHEDFHDFTAIAGDLAGQDACFFCLGVSSAGMKEPAYRRVTYDLTLAAARALVAASPQAAFIYVSGAGTNARGRSMWARVKGETEDALRALPFRAVYLFRPGFIQPRHGIRSKTRLYRFFYAVLGPLYPVWRTLLPGLVSTTDQVGRAMLEAARHGAPDPIVDNRAMNRLAAKALA